ncbi:hypothetical protein [Bacillus cihuensis]|uniref:hypothetical protein n=1 Tax=Bacillus cihuensis TaxID=1208599 RepID=UPI0003FF895F|nr:hypothetical protein [Bacillus cihuensis]
MKYFFVNIQTVDGNSESFNIKSESKVIIKKKITEASSGWFGIYGKYVQIKNIISFSIRGIELNEYNYEDKDFYLVHS